jgi:hypothetical protein
VGNAADLPTWAVLVISVGTALAAFAGGLIGTLVARRGARELEARSRREETMRSLRWGAELAVSADDRTARLGIAQLRALAESDLLDEGQQLFVDAALDAVVRVPADRIAEAGSDARVVQLEDDAGPDPGGGSALQSNQDSSGGGGGHG